MSIAAFEGREPAHRFEASNSGSLAAEREPMYRPPRRGSEMVHGARLWKHTRGRGWGDDGVHGRAHRLHDLGGKVVEPNHGGSLAVNAEKRGRTWGWSSPSEARASSICRSSYSSIFPPERPRSGSIMRAARPSLPTRGLRPAFPECFGPFGPSFLLPQRIRLCAVEEFAALCLGTRTSLIRARRERLSLNIHTRRPPSSIG